MPVKGHRWLREPEIRRMRIWREPDGWHWYHLLCGRGDGTINIGMGWEYTRDSALRHHATCRPTLQRRD